MNFLDQDIVSICFPHACFNEVGPLIFWFFSCMCCINYKGVPWCESVHVTHWVSRTTDHIHALRTHIPVPFSLPFTWMFKFLMRQHRLACSFPYAGTYPPSLLHGVLLKKWLEQCRLQDCASLLMLDACCLD